ncbi:helix-turn-helix transcriptional regulator [Streptosporangium longisporum]|uniref:LuxR C-terminal-related transcriptional regulator n=1 Tax=Streptosporangium longisporum TaxID=46187 RepID=A0ABP6KKU1_9ACTN
MRTDIPAAPPELMDTAVAVYRYAIMCGHVDAGTVASELGMGPAEAAEACENLLDLKLLMEKDTEGTLIPVHPDLALTVLNEPLADEIRRREQAIDVNTRRIQRISEDLARAAARPQGTEGVYLVSDPAEVQREIDAASLRCTREVVVMRPGGWKREGRRADAVSTEASMFKRGITRRMLFQHTTRASLGMRSYVARTAEHGGLVRTTSESLERMFVFDRQLAFIPTDPQGDAPSGAAMITHPVVVDFLYRGFERAWAGAMPFEGRDVSYDEVSADIKLSLLRMMASGLKDEVIANRLGMAARTCRRHMSAIMDELGATSRFQAGIKIAQMGVLSPEYALDAARDGRDDAHPSW